MTRIRMQIKTGCLVFLLASVQGCTTFTARESLYEQLGGEEGVARISRNFIREIGNDPRIRPYFEESDLKRFHEKLSEHICEVSGGGCEYSGDSMVDVHTGMAINEADFNRTVGLLINAMNQESIPHPVQNQLLQRLAPMYTDIVYR